MTSDNNYYITEDLRFRIQEVIGLRNEKYRLERELKDAQQEIAVCRSEYAELLNTKESLKRDAVEMSNRLGELKTENERLVHDNGRLRMVDLVRIAKEWTSTTQTREGQGHSIVTTQPTAEEWEANMSSADESAEAPTNITFDHNELQAKIDGIIKALATLRKERNEFKAALEVRYPEYLDVPLALVSRLSVAEQRILHLSAKLFSREQEHVGKMRALQLELRQEKASKLGTPSLKNQLEHSQAETAEVYKKYETLQKLITEFNEAWVILCDGKRK